MMRTKQEATEWAINIRLHGDEYLILDTETTGLRNSEMVQLGIIDMDKTTVMETLVKPTIEIPDHVIKIHGITDEMVKDAPTFPDVYEGIKETLDDRKLLIYNAKFDIGILNYCCDLHNLPRLDLSENVVDVMIPYATFVGDLNRNKKGFKWQKLNGDHSAIGDCIAVWNVIEKMANWDG